MSDDIKAQWANVAWISPPDHVTTESVIERLEDAQQIHEEKDADYGDAWRQVGHTMWRMAGEEPVTIEGPEDFASIGLYWERLIKLYRGFNGEFVNEELNFETIEDAHGDNIVYAAMHASLREDE